MLCSGKINLVRNGRNWKRDIQWNTFWGVMFWNFSFWEAVTTILGEVINPRINLPKALKIAMVLVYLNSVVPLSIFGAVPVQQWREIQYVPVAFFFGGKLFASFIYITHYITTITMFLTVFSCCVFQLHGMAMRGYIPKVFLSMIFCCTIYVLGVTCCHHRFGAHGYMPNRD